VGVVYLPDSAACYTSVKGQGVFLNGHSFERESINQDNVLQVYLDRSILKADYFSQLRDQLNRLAQDTEYVEVNYNIGYGAVCNAIGVLNSKSGCYFKFPKHKKGGGSIWDFAATRLFFEELELPVSNVSGDTLHLNNPESTFLNNQGVTYASNKKLHEFVLSLKK